MASKNKNIRDALIAELLEETSTGAVSQMTTLIYYPRQCLEAHSKYFDLIKKIRLLEADIVIPKPKRCEKTWKKFFDWMDFNIKKTGSEIVLQNSQLPSSSLSVKKVSEPDNYALIAKRRIEKGSQIVFVPKSAIISGETLIEDKALFDFVTNDPIAACMPNIVLVLYLLNEMSKDIESQWVHYLTVLPTTLLPVFSLDNEDFKSILHSTHITEMLRMVRSIARQYAYFYEKLKSTKLPLAKHFTYEYYAWGVSIVSSRQNEIISSIHFSHGCNALVPILDMCNHDPYSSQACQTDTFFRVFADKDYPIGSEIKINYGHRSSGDFFIHNGFVPNIVVGDSLPITLCIDQHDPFVKTKRRLADHFELGAQSRFVFPKKYDKCNLDKKLKQFLIIYFMREDDIEVMKTFDTGPEGFIDIMAALVWKDDKTTTTNNESDDETGIRFRKCINEYLSRRCQIASAIIDKIKIGDIHEKSNLQALLKAEQKIYNSYVIKKK